MDIKKIKSGFFIENKQIKKINFYKQIISKFFYGKF